MGKPKRNFLQKVDKQMCLLDFQKMYPFILRLYVVKTHKKICFSKNVKMRIFCIFVIFKKRLAAENYEKAPKYEEKGTFKVNPKKESENIFDIDSDNLAD